MEGNKTVLKKLPGVDTLLNHKSIQSLISEHNPDLIKYVIRQVLRSYRNNPPTDLDEHSILSKISNELKRYTGNSLKRVINATGVIIYTNLGRTPFPPSLLKEASAILTGYNNLEYDLSKGDRGTRYDHMTSKLKYLTGAEDVLVVNNNAAAVILVLRAFARNREVIISRGELIEIGGSFRVPEIMEASDCKMVEVGTTNKTHRKDYEKAINQETALLFKAHKSNYVIRGFTKEVSLRELVQIGAQHSLPVVYDMGSGLLRKTTTPLLKEEPDVRQTLAQGVDLVTFSGDKLIGGPQAGIIAGKKDLIGKLKKEPMVRALRVGKTTIALMEAALNYYLDDALLIKYNSLFRMLHQTTDHLKTRATEFQTTLNKHNIPSEINASEGYCGGGALPDESIPSFAVKIKLHFESGKKRSSFSERVFKTLLQQELPVIGILKKGELYFDVLTLTDEESQNAAEIVASVIRQLR
jgi:L-seryl-tRNA(Ser) seleniumtransferase